MACTVGCMVLDAERGIASVHLNDPANPNDETPAFAPNTHPGRIIFHSAWDYFEAPYDRAVTVTFPATASASNLVRRYALPPWTGGGRLHQFLAVSGQVVDASHRVQYASGTVNGGFHESERLLSLEVSDAGAVEIVEKVSVSFRLSTLPAIAVPLRVTLARVAPYTASPYAFEIDPEAGFMQFGYGRFDTRRNAKLRATAGAGVAFFPKLGPSIHTSGAGMRVVSPSGAIKNFWGYSGGFSGPGGWALKT